MPKERIRCITIVHPLSEIRIYRILSAFYRFIGIFVCENIAGREYGDDTDWLYKIEEGGEESKELLNQSIKLSLQEMKDLLDEDSEDVLYKIANIFEQYDLMRASYAIEYFGNCGKTYIYEQMMKAHEKFECALRMLQEIEDNKETDISALIYIWAAKSNCKRRMNEIYTIIWNAIKSGLYGRGMQYEMRERLWEKHYFNHEEINQDIIKILDNDPQNYGAYAIRGFAMEIDDDLKVDSVKDIMKAVQLIGNKSYTSYLLFRIARYCEHIRPNLNEKIKYYEAAWKVDPNNYRSIYKLAVNAQNHNYYKEAIDLWKNILEILERKKDLPCLQPIECAYIFKTYRNLGKLYIRLKKYEEGIKYLKNAVDIYNNRVNEDADKGFYPWMFYENEIQQEDDAIVSWGVYKAAAREKLQIIKTYTDIIDASARINRLDIYKKYTDIKQKLENTKKAI